MSSRTSKKCTGSTGLGGSQRRSPNKDSNAWFGTGNTEAINWCPEARALACSRHRAALQKHCRGSAIHHFSVLNPGSSSNRCQQRPSGPLANKAMGKVLSSIILGCLCLVWPESISLPGPYLSQSSNPPIPPRPLKQLSTNHWDFHPRGCCGKQRFCVALLPSAMSSSDPALSSYTKGTVGQPLQGSCPY